MAATLKLLPAEQTPADPVRGWNLTDLLRRVAADDRGPPDEDLIEEATAAPAQRKRPGTEAAIERVDALGPESDETWTEALDLAVEATDAIRIAEEHIARIEAQNRELESYLEKEVRSLQARMKAADEIVQRAEAGRAAAEARADRAEQRAETAERCLCRIRDQ